MLQFGTIFIALLIIDITLCQKQVIPLKDYLSVPSHRLELMKTDKELIQNLYQYADKLQENIDLLQRISDEIKQPLKEAKGREEEYLANPLNSFPLIRHMYSDWELLKKLMTNQVGQDQIDFLKKKLIELPLLEDVKEATEAIYRIEDTYEVEPEDMANGLIDGVQYNASLSALDCYDMAMHHYRIESYEKAIEWLNVASKLMSSGDTRIYNVLNLTHNDIILLMARCYLQMGDAKQVELLLNNDVNEVYKLLLARLSNIENNLTDNSYILDLLPKEYTELCRSSYKPKPSKLQCRYNTTTTTFLQLSPYRMEELSLNPYIVLYHNVLSDVEIKQLIEFSTPLFKRALIYNPELKNAEKFRTVDGVTLPTNEIPTPIEISNLVNRIIQRIYDITGLKLNLNDNFQIVRYGFGGHYSPHHDYFNVSTWFTALHGDRMATVLFYLNDVTHGGATVFPYLNLKVPAEKGKVLFFYNLDGESYDFNDDTFHGACPVISGIKMAMTCWINELNQMFIRPTYRPGNRVQL